MITIRKVDRFSFFEVEDADIWTPGAAGCPYKSGTVLVFDTLSEIKIGNEIAYASTDRDAQDTVIGLLDGTQKVSLAYIIERARIAEAENAPASDSTSDDSLALPEPTDHFANEHPNNRRQISKWM